MEFKLCFHLFLTFNISTPPHTPSSRRYIIDDDLMRIINSLVGGISTVSLTASLVTLSTAWMDIAARSKNLKRESATGSDKRKLLQFKWSKVFLNLLLPLVVMFTVFAFAVNNSLLVIM